MSENTFLGVFVTSEAPVTLGNLMRPTVKRKRKWFAWETGSGHFMVQALNAIMQPMAAARLVSGKEFRDRFVFDPSCTVTPADNSFSIPEPGGPGALFSLDSGQAPVLRADDPDLLRSWLLQGVPGPSEERKGGFSVTQQVVLDTLVDQATPGLADEDIHNFVDHGVSEEEMEKNMRADFTLALLQLKQGKKEQGMLLLEKIISDCRPDFAGAPELLSEFGLNLRRIGLLQAALRFHSKVLELAPYDERVYFNMARTYHDLGDFAATRKYLESALGITPGFAAARQFLNFLTIRTHEDAHAISGEDPDK